MNGSREDRMSEILRDLRADSPGVEAAVLVSSDAMPLASELGDSMDEELLSAMASSLVASGERVARDLSRGSLDQVYLRGEEGDLVVVRVNDDALLACVVNNQARMGMTLLEVNRCAARLSEII
ncbi:MAG: roadblock/LC7 domain-containing protein [Actinobacteria bacterium]|nr:roadblock/LC7 domain-containing protein [Actinomycetota bacterium]MBU2687384.1 roadblock/LC7 domain-containing protein [Actinomycetota bacterium]